MSGPDNLTSILHAHIATNEQADISDHGHSQPKASAAFETLVKDRHSIRVFRQEPVPKELLHESLALAQNSPSNSNTQPWQLYLASGASLERVVKALKEAASVSAPNIPPLPDNFKHYRTEFGKSLYQGGYGISRDDKDARAAAVLRNFEFFGAPLAGVICMDSTLDRWDSMSVGMWLQTFMLALRERGLGSCLQVSVVGYPEVLRKELNIGEGMTLLSGVAIGWPDESNKVNSVIAGREEYENHVIWTEG